MIGKNPRPNQKCYQRNSKVPGAYRKDFDVTKYSQSKKSPNATLLGQMPLWLGVHASFSILHTGYASSEWPKRISLLNIFLLCFWDLFFMQELVTARSVIYTLAHLNIHNRVCFSVPKLWSWIIHMFNSNLCYSIYLKTTINIAHYSKTQQPVL